MTDVFIKELISSCIEIFGKMFDAPIEQNYSIKSSSVMRFNDIITLISFNGDRRGMAFIHYPLSTANKLVSLMNKSTVDTDDELFIDSLNELGNRIVGKTVSRLNTEKFKIDITPPIYLVGENIKIFFKNKAIHYSNLKSSAGRITAGFGFEG